MKYSPQLEVEPVQLIGGRLVRKVIFPVEDVARVVLELTKSCGPKKGRGGKVTLVLPPVIVAEGCRCKLDVEPGESLDSLTQRIRDELKDGFDVYDEPQPTAIAIAPSRYRAGAPTYDSLFFGR